MNTRTEYGRVLDQEWGSAAINLRIGNPEHASIVLVFCLIEIEQSVSFHLENRLVRHQCPTFALIHCADIHGKGECAPGWFHLAHGLRNEVTTKKQ